MWSYTRTGTASHSLTPLVPPFRSPTVWKNYERTTLTANSPLTLSNLSLRVIIDMMRRSEIPGICDLEHFTGLVRIRVLHVPQCAPYTRALYIPVLFWTPVTPTLLVCTYSLFAHTLFIHPLIAHTHHYHVHTTAGDSKKPRHLPSTGASNALVCHLTRTRIQRHAHAHTHARVHAHLSSFPEEEGGREDGGAQLVYLHLHYNVSSTSVNP